MPPTNRTVTLPAHWADGAPNPPAEPISGTTYANANISASTIEAGWPFSQIVNSADFNEVMRRLTTLVRLAERWGVLPWSPLTAYEAGAWVLASDGFLYKAKANTQGHDPANQANPTKWIHEGELLQAHAALTAPHQATSAPTANRLVLRDASGRAQVATPAAAADIARKDTVDAHAALPLAHGATAVLGTSSIMARDANGRSQAASPAAANDIANKLYVDAHINDTGAFTPHGATAAGTANTVMKRDASGRAQVAAPSASADIARKDTVDAHAALTAPHEATSAATANRLMLRDAAGRAQVAAPSAAADIARKAEVDAHAITHTGNGLHGVWVGTVGPTGLFVQAPSGWAVARLAAGRYRVTHNRGNASYAVFVLPHSEFGFHVSASLADRTANSFEVWTHYGQETANPGFILRDNSFDFILVPKG